MEFIAEYGMFLLKALTVVVALVLTITGIMAASHKGGRHEPGKIEIRSLNERYEFVQATLQHEVLSPEEVKQEEKLRKKKAKEEHAADKKLVKKKAKERKKNKDPESTDGDTQEDFKKRIFVLDFDGDIQANAVENLREEISALLSVARDGDEVVLTLESGGGMVHAYGLAASQLRRVKDKGLTLTICVDKVAASGGYMMACIADKIRAAPFAIVGSVGVIAQLPNFHRVLKKYDVDYEIFTAGEFKRTVTMLGENTEKGRQKFIEELTDTHVLFKEFVIENRPQIDIDKIATGEVWFGRRALAVNLVDELGTSDQYLQDACNDADVFQVAWVHRKTLQDRLGLAVEVSVSRLINRGLTELSKARYPS